jgi:hypothetical protein
MTSSREFLPTSRGSQVLYPLTGSVILFLVACATPALILHVGQQLGVAGFHWQNYQSISGGHLLVSGLVFGWLRMNFTAFANLPLWASWIFFLRGRYAASRLCAWLALSVETLQLIVQPYLWHEAATRQAISPPLISASLAGPGACCSWRWRAIVCLRHNGRMLPIPLHSDGGRDSAPRGQDSLISD